MVRLMCTFWKKIDWMIVVTFLLFLATLGLYCSTRDLVEGGEKTSKLQLRAYITYVGDSRIDCANQTQGCGLSIEIKNSGITPAYNVTCFYASESRDTIAEPIVDENWYKLFRFDETGDATVDIGAGDQHRGLPACHRGTTIQNAIAGAGKTIYVWGVAKYRDVFQHCHIAAFIAKNAASSLQFLWQSSDGESNQDCVNGRRKWP